MSKRDVKLYESAEMFFHSKRKFVIQDFVDFAKSPAVTNYHSDCDNTNNSNCIELLEKVIDLFSPNIDSKKEQQQEECLNECKEFINKNK